MNVCVLLIGGLFTCEHAVGSEMVPVVGRVDDISVVELTVILE